MLAAFRPGPLTLATILVTQRQIEDSRKCDYFLDISIRSRDPDFSRDFYVMSRPIFHCNRPKSPPTDYAEPPLFTQDDPKTSASGVSTVGQVGHVPWAQLPGGAKLRNQLVVFKRKV
ncbi:hypothetical protein AVEN_180219-1 [Araneus ventricosus]|uniref:Uncharacterized protein n=1 Tax=Araneus ventricosus TaxID=182803 RepID=A0A4Y2N0A3_ARAVE|nr:hypothetical protein AVEN_180219-1 [Araneus ventricosus]